MTGEPLAHEDLSLAEGEGAPQWCEFRLGSAAETFNTLPALQLSCTRWSWHAGESSFWTGGWMRTVLWEGQSRAASLNVTSFPLGTGAPADVNWEDGSSHTVKRGKRVCMWHRQYKGHECNVHSSLHLSLQLNLTSCYLFTHHAGRNYFPGNVSNSLLNSLLNQNKYDHITF